MNTPPPRTRPKQEPPKVSLARHRLGLLEAVRTTRTNSLEFVPQSATELPIVTDSTGGQRWHMIMEPEALQQIFKHNVENYPKSEVTKSLLMPAVGDSIFLAEGESWRFQRRAAAHVFSHRNVTSLTPKFSASAEAMCNRLGSGGAQIDMYDAFTRATYDVIADVTFSGAGDFEPDEVREAIDVYVDQIARVALFDIMGMPKWLPRPSRLLKLSARRKMHKIANSTIQSRKASGPREVPDLLDLLISHEDQGTGRKMTDTEIRNNLLTYIIGGHETSALTASWALYLSAFDPVVQERLREEAQSVLQGRVATEQDCERLPYLRQVLNEALRLYPPLGIISRTAIADDVLSGQVVRARETIFLPIYALHRSHLFWEDPDCFDPERFAPGADYDKGAFLPFGDGPRACIGAQFAIVEIMIILSTVLSRYKFELIEGLAPKPAMIITLRPSGGVKLKVTPLPSEGSNLRVACKPDFVSAD